MAVEPFKLLTLMAPVHCFSQVVKSVVAESGFQPEEGDLVLKDSFNRLQPMGEDNPYEALLKKAVDIATANDIELSYQDFQQEDLTLTSIETALHQFDTELLTLKQQQQEILEKIRFNEKILEKIKYIENTDISLDELFHCQFIEFRFGRLPKEGYRIYQEQSWEDKNVFFFPTTTESRYIYGMYFTTYDDRHEVDSFFASVQFERMWLPDEAHGKPKNAYSNIIGENQRLKQEEVQLQEDIGKKVEAFSRAFLKYYSYLKYHASLAELKKYALKTENLFILNGWVPEGQMEAVLNRIQQLSQKLDQENEPLTYLVNQPESVSHTVPPTKLKNPKIFNFFESLVNMYGLPGYGEIDPTPLFAVTYTLLFGIMFGDVGQGLVLALLGLGLFGFKKMEFGKILMAIGVSSCLFGFVYGSVFGNEHILPGFKVMETSSHINFTLIATVLLGSLLLVVAMGFNIVNGVRQKELAKALCSPSGAAGMIFYLSIVVGVVLLVGFSINVFTYIYIGVFVVVPLLFIFFQENIHAFFNRHKGEEEVEKGSFMERIFELLEVMLSYVTNTVSFLRVGAFALNHVGMMLVVYILAGATEGGWGNPLVLILGNILVIGLEGLIVGIQVMRLEFYELFSRFYTGNGKEYKPFQINYEK